MAKKEKNIVMEKWLHLKELSKSDNPNIDEIDELSCDLITNLAEMSMRGITEVDGIAIDLMKDRVWWVIQKHGLLPEYKDPDEEPLFEIKDDWETPEDDEFQEEINEEDIYNQL
jgi:hypothetical protein